MRFAMIDNKRSVAAPGLSGTCPSCAREMIAKCGERRDWHWAHKGNRMCDSWWEPETDWHRAWKNHFPSEWQEVIAYDASGEKHIADVRTEMGLVLEFQHSHLNPAERTRREAFHRNLVWVVDGMRLKRDLPRFEKAKSDLRKTPIEQVWALHFPEEYLPGDWITSSVTVVFDFWRAEDDEPLRDERRFLWCLLPGRIGGSAFLTMIPRDQFIKMASERIELLPTRTMLEYIASHYRLAKEASDRAATEYDARQRFYRAARRSRRF